MCLLPTASRTCYKSTNKGFRLIPVVFFIQPRLEKLPLYLTVSVSCSWKSAFWQYYLARWELVSLVNATRWPRGFWRFPALAEISGTQDVWGVPFFINTMWYRQLMVSPCNLMEYSPLLKHYVLDVDRNRRGFGQKGIQSPQRTVSCFCTKLWADDLFHTCSGSSQILYCLIFVLKCGFVDLVTFAQAGNKHCHSGAAPARSSDKWAEVTEV